MFLNVLKHLKYINLNSLNLSLIQLLFVLYLRSATGFNKLSLYEDALSGCCSHTKGYRFVHLYLINKIKCIEMTLTEK